MSTTVSAIDPAALSKRLDADLSQSEQVSRAVRLPYEAGASAACTVLAVVHRKVSAMAIIGMALARRKLWSWFD